jgi:hypothetical protein
MNEAEQIEAEIEAASKPKVKCRMCAAPEALRRAVEHVDGRGTGTFSAMSAILAKHGYPVGEKAVKKHLRGCARV